MIFQRQPRNAESEISLLQRAANWPKHAALENLTAEVLRQITETEGVDFATALLFHRLTNSPTHAEFIRHIEGLRRGALPFRAAAGLKVVVVPGALYVERPEMGGDGRLIREVAKELGWPSEIVPLASRGSVVENARLLGSWIARQGEERMILVSLSKGGADLKLALAAPDASTRFRKVLAWVNVCGPLNGSRLVDWVLASRLRTGLLRFQYRWQRRDFGFITDLRSTPGGPLNSPVHLPPAMRLISLVGFSLERHLTTPFARFCHRTLARWGPNDGSILLFDLREWPGAVYPVWGADHYFRPENMARSLITAVLTDLSRGLQAAESIRRAASPPT